MDDPRNRLGQAVRYGLAELVPDAGRPGSWTLRIDGVAQSYVDLEDPCRLVAEYALQLAAVVEAVAPAGQALHVLHLGGGGLTLPRYIAAVRPGSRQLVIEHDDLLLEFVLRFLPLDGAGDVDLVVGDAREVVTGLASSTFDLVIADVAEVAQMPSSVASAECTADIARILRPQGVYAVNVPDLPDLTFARRVGATLRAEFGDVCAVREPTAWPGRRYANAVFAAARGPGGLPIQRLAELVGREPIRGQALHAATLESFVGGAMPIQAVGG